MKARTANSLMAFISGLLVFYCIFLFMEEAGATGCHGCEGSLDRCESKLYDNK